jgi:hypothetical protein
MQAMSNLTEANKKNVGSLGRRSIIGHLREVEVWSKGILSFRTALNAELQSRRMARRIEQRRPDSSHRNPEQIA